MTARLRPVSSGMRGVLNVNKPGGITSYDVIRHLKRLSEPRAIGHAGTLDPAASGVLLVLINEATRISRFLLTVPKEYDAVVLFGKATDTDDASGRVIAETPVPGLSAEELRVRLEDFTGTFEQVPPIYSALRQQGARFYELARRGVAARPRPRMVTVHELELIEWSPPRARLRALVSSGTYVRSLARDVGQAVGSAATLETLVRTRVGEFRIADALDLESATEEAVAKHLVPTELALPDMPRFEISDLTAHRLLNGQRVEATTADVRFAFACNENRGFLAVVSSSGGLLRPVRIIHAGWHQQSDSQRAPLRPTSPRAFQNPESGIRNPDSDLRSRNSLGR